MNKLRQFLIKIKSNKKILVILFIILFSLIIVSLIPYNKNETTSTTENLVGVEAYVDSLEKKLSSVLTKVDGVGKVSCVITIKSGMETVLAMKTTQTQTSNGVEIVETPILVNGKTVVLKELYPEIKGVLVVAEGAKNIAVMTRIQQAITALLDININKIEILSMK